ncbi:MAG: hypothetical protein AAGG38_04335 [Planctomycetota bacterium]
MLLQTLFFKLAYAPETQVIFGDIGGRPAATFTGLMELVTAALLLPGGAWIYRKLAPGSLKAFAPYAPVLGAFMAAGVLAGAIATHLLIIGIILPIAPGSTETDGGSLFALAMGLTLISLTILFLRRRETHELLHAVHAKLTRGGGLEDAGTVNA